MIPGMILGGILLFLLLILWIPLKIWLVYDGGLRIRLRVAFLSFPLYPRDIRGLLGHQARGPYDPLHEREKEVLE